jgi:hypothetical protein
MARPEIPIDEGKVGNPAEIGSSVEKIASLVSRQGTKSEVDPQTEVAPMGAASVPSAGLAGKLAGAHHLLRQIYSGD